MLQRRSMELLPLQAIIYFLSLIMTVTLHLQNGFDFYYNLLYQEIVRW